MPKLTKTRRNSGIKNQDNLAKTRVSKTTSPGQSTETQVIHQSGKFFRQDKTFGDKAIKLYKELGKKSINMQSPPSLKEVEQKWS